jgi:hypothetical protein
VTAFGEARRAVWCRRMLVVAALAGAALLLSGALAAIYVRPYGHHPVTHVRLAVTLTAVLRVVHGAGAAVFCLALVVAGALGRAWQRAAIRARADWAVAALLGFFILLGGLVMPWSSLLPWTPVVGPNLARPVELLGYDGPFGELVGVNVRYDDALLALGRWRVGPKGVGRLYFDHLVVMPLAAVIAVWYGERRRRRRVSQVTREGVRPLGSDPTS